MKKNHVRMSHGTTKNHMLDEFLSMEALNQRDGFQISSHLAEEESYSKLNSENTLFVNLRGKQSSRFTDLKTERDVYLEWSNKLKDLYNNLVLETFYGVLLNREECTACGWNQYYFSLFSGLEVDVEFYSSKKGKDRVMKIEELVAKCFSLSYSENQICKRCRMKTIHANFPKVYTHPSALLINLEKNLEPEKNPVFIQVAKANLQLQPHSYSQMKGEYVLRYFVNRTAKSKPLRARERASNILWVEDLEDESTEMIYYCDHMRTWVHHHKVNGIDSEPNPSVIDGSHRLSYCMYEFKGEQSL